MTNKELIHRLLKIPKKKIKGSSMYEIVNSLPDNRTELVKEICCRYGEKRLPKGERFTSARAVYDHFKMRVNRMQEDFYCVYLDSKDRIIFEKLITQGTLNLVLVHPRECFAPAIQSRAASVILIHNHPSGDPLPGEFDFQMTEQLCEVGKLVGIHVLDHLIIGDKNYFSFSEEDLLPVSYKEDESLVNILLRSGVLAPIEKAPAYKNR
jgi:DNA repair protein RadC